MKKTKPIFLFVCTENACRSQMAEGVFNNLTKMAQAMSAGPKPTHINPMAIEVMKDRDINISQNTSKLLTHDLVQNSFKVVTMGCIDECPFTPPEKTIKWDIPDPKGKSKEFFISVRDTIEKGITSLLQTYSLL